MDLLLIWHFHQPWYGRPGTRQFELPWVRLHAAKSYLDMASLLTSQPNVRATANFSGGLLEQLGCYRDGWRDTFFNLSLKPASTLTDTERQYISAHFFSLDWDRVVPRFPRLCELLDRRGRGLEPASWRRLSDAEITDLQVLFNLAWCGFTLRESEPLKALVEQGRAYQLEDVKTVLDSQLLAIDRVIELWSALVQSGQVELCVSPQYHPILPLLVDSDCAQRCQPNRPRPPRFAEPAEAADQIALALRTADETFGVRPRGMWPSEGSVSPEVVALIGSQQVDWIATDEEVLLKSVRHPETAGRTDVYQPWTAGPHDTFMFFRDRELSDLLGFSYQRSTAQAATSDFESRLDRLASRYANVPRAAVTVILDGENAWEHYDDDGREFLTAFHDMLATSTHVRTSTPSDYLKRWSTVTRNRIQHLHTGSWIYANFHIWIGGEETNRAWTLLGDAHRVYAAHIEGTGGGYPAVGQSPEALRALRRAQASDWFWWYGDDFNSAQDELFDELFRENLKMVYREMGRPVPRALEHSLYSHRQSENRFRPPEALIRPSIDGRSQRFFDWACAAELKLLGDGGSMAQRLPFERLRLGFSNAFFFLQLTPGEHFTTAAGPNGEHPELSVNFRTSRGVKTAVKAVVTGPGRPHCTIVRDSSDNTDSTDDADVGADAGLVCYYRNTLELQVPRHSVGTNHESGSSIVAISVVLECEGIELQRLPRFGTLNLDLPSADFDAEHWIL